MRYKYVREDNGRSVVYGNARYTISEKKCTKCGEWKPIEQFTRNKQNASGYDCLCKDCLYQLKKEQREKKLGRKIKSRAEWLEQARLKREEKEKRAEEFRKKIETNKKLLEDGKKMCNKCGCIKQLEDFHNDKTKAGGVSNICKKCDTIKCNAYRRNPENKEKVSATRRKWHKIWSQSEKGKWNNRVHKMLYNAIGQAKLKKPGSIIKWVGVDCQTLQEHLAKTYEDRYGEKYTGQEVHIDHKIPISKARNMDEARYLCHWTNLQFLKGEDNLNKKDKILPEFRELWKKFLEFRKSLAHA